MSKIGDYVLEQEEALDAAAASINDGDYAVGKTIEEKAEPNVEKSYKNKAEDKVKKTDFDMFRDFVNASGAAISVKGKLYLRVEAWQYLAYLKGIVPSCKSFAVNNTGEPLEVETICTLKDVKTGETISQTHMIANKSEKFLSELDDYAVWGLSQTRAVARAIKNIYGYIACGAGYESTPLEEIR